ncbi:MAG: DUF2231 domain-containing protein [Myxococcota bacterium]|nr:DUF2231 domain-containing protein [Myxococcota bacterium]
MLPDPLHPALVHLPLALAMLIPLLGLLAALAIARRYGDRSLWAGIVLLQVLLAGSGWVAAEAGEDEEERVEEVVAHRWIHEHEEAAERLIWLAALAVPLAAAGMARGRTGAVARGLHVAAAVGILAAAWTVGESGGALVYEHGAASVYTEPAPTGEGADDHAD